MSMAAERANERETFARTEERKVKNDSDGKGAGMNDLDFYLRLFHGGFNKEDFRSSLPPNHAASVSTSAAVPVPRSLLAYNSRNTRNKQQFTHGGLSVGSSSFSP